MPPLLYTGIAWVGLQGGRDVRWRRLRTKDTKKRSHALRTLRTRDTKTRSHVRTSQVRPQLSHDGWSATRDVIQPIQITGPERFQCVTSRNTERQASQVRKPDRDGCSPAPVHVTWGSIELSVRGQCPRLMAHTHFLLLAK
jgi:hypothetical protein